MASNPKVITMPSDPKERRERQLIAKWLQEDELNRRLRDLRAEIRPLQHQVSVDQGYGFTVSREALQLAFKARERRAAK